MTTLLLVEDNAIFAKTLARFLREQGNYTVAAVLSSAETALEALPTLVIDLVVVDVSLPQMNGIQLVATLRQQYPALPCLVLSGNNEISYVSRALAAGAKGYVLKENPPVLLTAIEQILAGETYLSEGLAKTLHDGTIPP